MAKIKTNQISLKRVDSENIWAAGYDAKARILKVRFRNGSEYIYHNVPPEKANTILTGKETHEGTTQHISIGSYLNRQIVGHYEYKKVKDKS